MLDIKAKDTIKYILANFSQMNHLGYFKKWDIKKKKKEDFINEILNNIENDEVKKEDFVQWFNKFTIDGNNYYYVFDCEKFDKKSIEKYVETIECIDLININYNDIKSKTCILKESNEDKNRVVLKYVSPAYIQIREKENGGIKVDIEKTLYFNSVVIDYSLNQLIIVIPHTKGLISVAGKSIVRGNFKEIVTNYIDELSINCNAIKANSCINWIYNALDSFAEEGSYHNNPDITDYVEKNDEKIKNFCSELMRLSGIESNGIVNNFNEDLKILYESMLIEGLGKKDGLEEYQVYMINGDKVNSIFNVESRTESLNKGREFAIAKTVRQISDIKILGIKKVLNNDGNVDRFLIEVDVTDNKLGFYMIKTDTSKFMKESGIYNVIKKVGSYKEFT